MSAQQPPADIPPTRASAWRFPVDVLTEHAAWQSLWARAVLVSLPFQYVTLTHVPGGFEQDEYGGVALAVLLYLLCVWLTSLALAVRGGPGYQERVRRRAFALVVTWTIAELLLALSLAYNIWRFNVTQDVVGGWFCGKDKWQWVSCLKEYPGLNPETFVAYTIYSLLAVALAAMSAKVIVQRTKGTAIAGRQAGNKPATAPFLATVVLATALLMTLVHSATALYGWSFNTKAEAALPAFAQSR